MDFVFIASSNAGGIIIVMAWVRFGGRWIRIGGHDGAVVKLFSKELGTLNNWNGENSRYGEGAEKEAGVHSSGSKYIKVVLRGSTLNIYAGMHDVMCAHRAANQGNGALVIR
jgi:hypothetical protein